MCRDECHADAAGFFGVERFDQFISGIGCLCRRQLRRLDADELPCCR
jgi:hypothetical protein